MTNKKKIKLFVDLLMIIILPILMAYSLIGERLHEWLGVAMFVLFIVHHFLNWGWYQTLFKGRYTLRRFTSTVLDVLLFIDMLTLMVSGIILSRYIFDFPIQGGIALARTWHLLGAFWGFILMSVHAGFHVKGIWVALVNATSMSKLTSRKKIIFQTLAAAVLAYGVYAFINRQIIMYLFLKIEYVFFDFSEPLIGFFLDYLAMMVLFACIGHIFVDFTRKNIR